MKRAAYLYFVMCLALGSAGGWSASAQPALAGPPTTEPAAPGKDAFVQHCAVCHGPGGRGDGPLAGALKVVPADLTAITVRYKGQFPSAKLADVIRNGGGLLGHGTIEMPAWGMAFGEKGNPDIARARIGELILYIESLQAK